MSNENDPDLRRYLDLLRGSPTEPLRSAASRRDFLRDSARVAAATGLMSVFPNLFSACGPREATSDPTPPPAGGVDLSTPVKIGYIPITDATPLLVAHAMGFFEEEGLKVEAPTLIRGWAPLSEAFMARKFNLCHLLWPIPIYMRFSQNYPVKVVAWDHLNGSAITVGKESGIWELEDLRGKQIAVPYWYSVHNIVLQLILREYDIKVTVQSRNDSLKDNETNLFVMAPPDMPTAVANKSIDGYVVAEPFNAAGELLAEARVLRFTGDVFKNHPCCVAVMHEDVIDEQREWSQRVVNAVVKAELYAKDHTEEVAVMLSKDGKGYLPMPAKVVVRAMTHYDLEDYGPLAEGKKPAEAERAVAIEHPEWDLKRLAFQPFQYRSTTTLGTELLKKTHVEGDSTFLEMLDPERVADELMEYEMVTQAVEKVGGLVKFDGVDGQNPAVREELIEV